MIITTNSSALNLEFGAQRQGDLTHWHFDTFRARWSDVRLEPSLVVFLPDGSGGVSALRAFGLTFARAEQAR